MRPGKGISLHDGAAEEFDIQTGAWKSLEPVLGSFGVSLSRDSGIVKDPFDQNLVWIGNFHNGVLLYDTARKAKTHYKPDLFSSQSITGIVPDRTVVWVGTSGGLFWYERKTGKIAEKKEFADVWVRTIIIDGRKLWINGEFVLNRGLNTIKSVYEFPNWSIPKVTDIILVNGYKIFWQYEGAQPLLILDREDRIVATGRGLPWRTAAMDRINLWLCGGTGCAVFDTVKNVLRDGVRLGPHSDRISYLSEIRLQGDYVYYRSGATLGRFHAATGRIEIIPDIRVRALLSDPSSYWILDSDSLVRINKAGMDNLFQPLEQVVEGERASQSASPAATGSMVENLSWTAAEIERTYALLKGAELESAIYAKRRTLKVTNPEELQRLKEQLKGPLPPLEKELAYYFLATGPFVVGDPELALEYYALLAREFPKGRPLSWISKQDMEKMKRAAQESREIRAGKVPEDEKLWLLGKLFFETLCVAWNEGEVGCNFAYPRELFSRLIKNHPRSPWADNAEFTLLQYDEGLIHEGGDITLNCIPKYEAFLAKYPKSEYAAAAKMALGDHYYSFVEGSLQMLQQEIAYEKISDLLGKARLAFADVRRLYPDTKEAGQAAERLQAVEQLLDRYAWALTITTDKTEYRVGEPVIVTYVLKNLRNVERKISILDNLPNFGVAINRFSSQEEPQWSKVPFVRALDAREYAPDTTKNVAKDGSYSESWNILDMTATEQQGRRAYGKFVISQEGRYTLRAHYSDPDDAITMHSPEIYFDVLNNRL